MTDHQDPPGARPFDLDAAAGGYEYTDPNRLSAVVANKRISEALMSLADWNGKRVIDIGCGDGTYTADMVNAGAGSVVGVDAAAQAIDLARSKNLKRATFEVVDLAKFAVDERYDIAVVRGVIHHIDELPPVMDMITRAAKQIVVMEPNGYNPGLKILEKVHPYHRAHGERSYSPRKLDGWFEERGGRVERGFFVGLVPMFSPDWMVKILKPIEPAIERIRGIRAISCAQYIMSVQMP